ncbi:MAG: RluA family pseudouridine synthase [Clostridia bacterium]|nr:RluA family pseudouridine synthase [Clostridia bacterium]
MTERTFSVSDEFEFERIDKYLSIALNETAEQIFSRSAVSVLLEDGNVLLNGKKVVKSAKIKRGDVIVVRIPAPKVLEAVSENIPLEIAYEDPHLLVVNKPQGMVVHPAPGNLDGTLVNALLYHCQGELSGINGVLRPGIVHRIDKDTSGLLIVAKTNDAHLGLAEQIKEHSFLREYEAIVIGRLREPFGTIDAPIGRDSKDRKKMAITMVNSKNAVTHYRVLQEFQGYSHVRFRLETGRTHQIRVHMSYNGHPIVGDPIYAPKNAESFGLRGQCLHAKKIGFIHPITKQYLEFDSDLPTHFTHLLDRLRKKYN